jgi:hypothetical protein
MANKCYGCAAADWGVESKRCSTCKAGSNFVPGIVNLWPSVTLGEHNVSHGDDCGKNCQCNKTVNKQEDWIG